MNNNCEIESKKLRCCLFYTSNALARAIASMAEEEFRPMGFSPAHAFLLNLVIKTPGISPGELAKRLELAPSTVTRFIESLEKKSLLNRISEGRATSVFPTNKGIELQSEIELCWSNFKKKYAEILGEEDSQNLVDSIYSALKKIKCQNKI